MFSQYFVDISNELSSLSRSSTNIDNVVSSANKRFSENLELNPPITIRIYNSKHYRIFPTNTKLLVFVEDARIKINSIYNIEIS